MAVKRRVSAPKQIPIATIEMEVAIAKYFGIRQHIIVPNISWGFGMHECDLFIITKAGVAIEIEIKKTRSDLLADFKKGHDHKDKQNRITEFYFAIPEYLYEKCKDLIPEDAGIITCYRWTDYMKRERIDAHIKRKATRRKGARKLTTEEQMRIARLGTMRIWTLKEKIIKLKDGTPKKIQQPTKRKTKTKLPVQW
jgi:hypothetical protein